MDNSTGFLTGIAGVLGGITALVVALKEANLIGRTPDTAVEAVTPEVVQKTATAEIEKSSANPHTTDKAEAPQVGADIALEQRSGFQGELDSYLKDPGFKAMFVAIDGKSGWIIGSSSEEITQDDADAAALSTCQTELADSDVEGDCKVYARGNEIVWKAIP